MKKRTLKKLLKTFKLYEEKMSMALGMVVVIFVASFSIWFFQAMRMQRAMPEQQANLSELPPQEQLVELSALPTQRIFTEKDGQFFVENLPVYYRVQSGDSTWKIAQAIYGAGENYIDIERENGLSANQSVEAGQKLIIPNVPTKLDLSEMKKISPVPLTSTPAQATVSMRPSKPASHVVGQGEGLWQIAQQHYGDGNQYMRIFQANRNQMKSPEDIRVGMQLVLP